MLVHSRPLVYRHHAFWRRWTVAQGNPARVARVLRVTIQGVWLDVITTTPDYTIEEGLATTHACAAAFFPRHFCAAGLIL